MALFSERQGYTQKPLQFETMSQALKNRIWNVYSCEVCTDVCDYDSHYLEEILDYLGLPVENVYDVSDVLSNLDKLKNGLILLNGIWCMTSLKYMLPFCRQKNDLMLSVTLTIYYSKKMRDIACQILM